MECLRCRSENVIGEYGDDDHGNSGYVYTCKSCGLAFGEDDINNDEDIDATDK